MARPPTRKQIRFFAYLHTSPMHKPTLKRSSTYGHRGWGALEVCPGTGHIVLPQLTASNQIWAGACNYRIISFNETFVDEKKTRILNAYTSASAGMGPNFLFLALQMSYLFHRLLEKSNFEDSVMCLKHSWHMHTC